MKKVDQYKLLNRMMVQRIGVVMGEIPYSMQKESFQKYFSN
jgi:hypothetical protein